MKKNKMDFEFEMNGMTWKILEMSQEEIKSLQNERKAGEEQENVKNLTTRYYGITYHDSLQIILDKNLNQERKRRTLCHELIHCYIGSFITHQEKTYDEEMVADIASNAHDIIDEIMEYYFLYSCDDDFEECEEKIEPFCEEECIINIESEVVA